MDAILHSANTWIAVAFFICLGVIAKYVLPMITRGLDARAVQIRDQLEQAKRLREEAQALLATYQQEQEAKLQEAEAMLANARAEAEALRTRAADELKAAIDRRQKQASEKIARAEAEAIATIRTRMVNLATEASRAIISEQLQGKAEDPAVARAIASIEQQIH